MYEPVRPEQENAIFAVPLLALDEVLEPLLAVS